MGFRGLRWPQLLPDIMSECQRGCPPPAILLLHAGGNCIGKEKLAVLLSFMKTDIERLQLFFPECVLIWSEMIARRHWRAPGICRRLRKQEGSLIYVLPAIYVQWGVLPFDMPDWREITCACCGQMVCISTTSRWRSFCLICRTAYRGQWSGWGETALL
ncbi:hypothetical protein PRIEUP_LOCUS79, partial [Pristimantis euphronides]